MAIKRIYPTQDTFVTDYDPNHPTLNPSYSNFGASQVLHLYKWGATRSEILIRFSDADIASIPSGSQVKLHISNAIHADTLPAGYLSIIRPLEQEWVEGNGQDITTYTDISPANFWLATSDTTWSLGTGTLSSSFYFNTGLEDLDADITNLTGAMHFGLDVMMNPFAPGNLFIKKFHSRQSNLPEKRPYIEARWADWTGSLTTASLFYVTSGDYSGTYWPNSMASSPASGSGTLITSFASDVDPTGSMVFLIPDLKTVYDRNEKVRLGLYAQRKDWNPAVVNSASATSPNVVLTECYYRVVDDVSGVDAIPFGTGSVKHTKLSYNDNGSYFDFDMSTLMVGPSYRFDFLYNAPTGSTRWNIVSGNAFKFRLTDTDNGQ